jgi:beta-glucosidase
MGVARGSPAAGWVASSVALALLLVPMVVPRSAAAQPSSSTRDDRVESLLAKLTLEEKTALMAGGSGFGTKAIPRLGIASINLSDGPNGVRSNDDQPATVFPTGSALAATWNTAVLQAVGEAIGREALAMHVGVMLGPNVNIQRWPLAGRNFEDYSEDPYLAGILGSAFVRGVQSQGVGTSVKHFVANEQELERMSSSSNVDERTLREIYLLPFEMIVRSAEPWTVMASYNRLNGTYLSENHRLLHDVLEGEWRFPGLVVSDWGAVHSTAAAASSGLDLEMPGPPRYFGEHLAEAVRNHEVPEEAIDEAVRRVLALVVRAGALDVKPRAGGELLSARNRAVALGAAREAVTLLKNEHSLLPLDKSRIHTLAIIGPNADVPLYGGGGSAAVIPSRILTPLESLRRLLGPAVRVIYTRGVDNDAMPPPADARLMSPTRTRAQAGLAFRYYGNADFKGNPIAQGVANYFDKLAIGSKLGVMSARWEGYLWAPRDGDYSFSLSQNGDATLWIDDQIVIGAGHGRTLPPTFDFGAEIHLAEIALKAGKPHRIRVDYSTSQPFHSMHLGLREPTGPIDEAARVAQGADAAIVFVGSSRSTETEGRDRRSMRLEGTQNELVQTVLAVNPNTIVVLQSGAPYAMPWVQRAPAILEGWLAGEEGADAIAEVLLGEVNPSGKLPMTFPQRLQDSPAYLYYSDGPDANYGEGVFVGYRYFDRREVEPLFPFGHGLSYTKFEYRNLVVATAGRADGTVEVSVDVRNTGTRAGAETVQLYVGDAATTVVVRPLKELKGFRKIELTPGQSQTVHFTLVPRDLSYYDIARHDWIATSGTHRILVGSSSRDIRQTHEFEYGR